MVLIIVRRSSYHSFTLGHLSVDIYEMMIVRIYLQHYTIHINIYTIL